MDVAIVCVFFFYTAVFISISPLRKKKTVARGFCIVLHPNLPWSFTSRALHLAVRVPDALTHSLWRGQAVKVEKVKILTVHLSMTGWHSATGPGQRTLLRAADLTAICISATNNQAIPVTVFHFVHSYLPCNRHVIDIKLGLLNELAYFQTGNNISMCINVQGACVHADRCNLGVSVIRKPHPTKTCEVWECTFCCN